MNLNAYKKRLQQRGGQCQHPKCTATLNLTVDHIVPRQLLKCLNMEHFAETDEENFQVLCKKHNVEKANMLDYTNARTLPMLKKYINLWIEKHSDYFIPPEKRVYKLGVKCACNEVHTVVNDVVVHKGKEIPVPATLDTSKWKNPPSFARKNKFDGDDW